MTSDCVKLNQSGWLSTPMKRACEWWYINPFSYSTMYTYHSMLFGAFGYKKKILNERGEILMFSMTWRNSDCRAFIIRMLCGCTKRFTLTWIYLLLFLLLFLSTTKNVLCLALDCSKILKFFKYLQRLWSDQS